MGAIFHMSMKAIGRAGGRSATGAAAYRSASRVVDERTGEIHDYTKKKGVAHSELILPGGATADRADFWNRVEQHHKRGDAVLCREVEVSLPSDLSPEARKSLAQQYGRELADRYGVAVDIAIHEPREVTDRDLEKNPEQHTEIDPATGKRTNGNHHVHMLMSACRVSLAGELGKKAEELDPIHCKRHKIEAPAERERPRWAELTNSALERAGSALRVDHRSHEERGIQQEPTRHLGPTAAAIERRGEVSQKRLDWQAEAADRLARAKEAGELERESKWLDRTILVERGELAKAESAHLVEKRTLAELVQERDRQPAPAQENAFLRMLDEQAKPNWTEKPSVPELLAELRKAHSAKQEPDTAPRPEPTPQPKKEPTPAERLAELIQRKPEAKPAELDLSGNIEQAKADARAKLAASLPDVRARMLDRAQQMKAEKAAQERAEAEARQRAEAEAKQQKAQELEKQKKLELTNYAKHQGVEVARPGMRIAGRVEDVQRGPSGSFYAVVSLGRGQMVATPCAPELRAGDNVRGEIKENGLHCRVEEPQRERSRGPSMGY